MPVSEVGDAVIGRGFGLMHRRGASKAVDTAKFPYTLDNPAHGSFGLSSVVRIQVQGDGGVGVRAISVAEVVSPGGHADALARDVMVALARSGVTATCTTADKARYGDLAVDSNLPDIANLAGRIDVNAFSAAVLAGRDVEGVGNVWVPADAPLADVWVPGADLRGLRVLPVLVVTSPDGLADAVANLRDELNYSEIYAVGLVPLTSSTTAPSPCSTAGYRVRRRHRRHPAHVADEVVRDLHREPGSSRHGAPRPTAATSSCSTGRTSSTTRSPPPTVTGGG